MIFISKCGLIYHRYSRKTMPPKMTCWWSIRGHTSTLVRWIWVLGHELICLLPRKMSSYPIRDNFRSYSRTKRLTRNLISLMVIVETTSNRVICFLITFSLNIIHETEYYLGCSLISSLKKLHYKN